MGNNRKVKAEECGSSSTNYFRVITNVHYSENTVARLSLDRPIVKEKNGGHKRRNTFDTKTRHMVMANVCINGCIMLCRTNIFMFTVNHYVKEAVISEIGGDNKTGEIHE